MRTFCGAKTRAGGTCRQPALANGRCRYHGGKTPVGIESVHFRHGRYSKYLPARLAARYSEAQQDPALLELRAEIALIDTRLTDVLDRLDKGESGALWEIVSSEFDKFKKAQVVKDTDEARAALSALDSLFTDGIGDYAAWKEVSELVEQRRKLVESERKHEVETQQTLSVEQALSLIGSIHETIRRHVADSAARQLIAADLARLVGNAPGAGGGGGRGARDAESATPDSV